MISDRESSILELQLNNDMLTARMADSAADLGPDRSQQVCPSFAVPPLHGAAVRTEAAQFQATHVHAGCFRGRPG